MRKLLALVLLVVGLLIGLVVVDFWLTASRIRRDCGRQQQFPRYDGERIVLPDYDECVAEGIEREINRRFGPAR